MPAEAPVAAPAEETSNPTMQVPNMPEGEAASPQVNTPQTVGIMDADAAATTPEDAAEANEEVSENPILSETRATQLAQLAAATLKPEDCSKENIVARAQKFASLDDEQLKILLSANNVAIASEEEEKEEEDKEKEASSCTASSGEIEVANTQSVDVGSFDLTEEFNDGPINASPEDDSELASIFGEAPLAPQMPMAADALTASIAQLAGKAKTASKVGVQSVGSAKLQGSAPAAEGNELESIWNAPAEFPTGGF
jgi:hypothetical protein